MNMGTNRTGITPMGDMKLIPGLDLPPSCRTVWVSEEARKTWAPVIPKVSAMVSELEVLSVAKGHRPCAWQTIAEDQFPRLAAAWAEMDLVSLPILRVRSFTGFAHRHETPRPGERASVCVIVAGSLKDALRFKAANASGDNDVQGELLGFPKCCRKFFDDAWAGGFFDPVWQAAIQTTGVMVNDHSNRPLEPRELPEPIRHVTVSGHPFANSILRYAGLRVGFHLPCAFDCRETIKVAIERMTLADQVDARLADILQGLLSMPMSWDVYHGIAVVRTPIFYLIVPSVPAAERHVVEVVSMPEFVPKESARGTGFPFTVERKNDAENS